MAGPSSAKYSPIEHGGLEIAERNDAPEVVHAGRNSNEQPETLHPGQYQEQSHENSADLLAADPSAPAYDRPAYMSSQEKGYVAGQTVEPVKPKRKYCGMRPLVLAIVVVVAVIVVLGVVLGAALGTTLGGSSNKKSSNSSNSPPAALNSSDTSSGPLEATDKTGLATATLDDGSGTLLAYYQDPDGRVIQNSYLNGAWALEDHSQINNSIVTDQAALGSPLAAISYSYSNQVYRQLFFFSSTGAVMQTNTTDGKTWEDPSDITTDTSSPSSPALAACAGQAPMNGIRVYYGSYSGYIQEVGHDFDNLTWNVWHGFSESDPDSGVACSVYKTKDNAHMYNNVYFRNTTDNQIHQNYFDYSPDYDVDWYTEFPPAPTNHTVNPGSAVAVCNDESETEYVFWQEKSGNVIRGIVSPSTLGWDQFDNFGSSTSGGRLAAAYIESGSLYMFQNSSSESTVWVKDVSRSSVDLSNIAMPKQ